MVPTESGTQLIRRFSEALERDLTSRELKTVRGPWIVGFSHGADSSALLLLLNKFVRSVPQGDDRPILHPIHVDHGLRPESADEARQAKEFCKRIGLPCEIQTLSGGGGESWARQERYRIFEARAEAMGASLVVLAHHRDDDLETLCFRLLRGTGPLGLAGIPRLRPLSPSTELHTYVYRPLLGIGKADLLHWLEELGQAWIEDPSNARVEHTPRNRIRHELLPRIQANPRAWEALQSLKREAELFSALIHEELRDLPLAKTGLSKAILPLDRLQALSPWAFERYLSLLLESLGEARPSRALLRQARVLLQPGLPSGKCIEARGRWRLERRKLELHLRLLGP